MSDELAIDNMMLMAELIKSALVDNDIPYSYGVMSSSCGVISIAELALFVDVNGFRLRTRRNGFLSEPIHSAKYGVLSDPAFDPAPIINNLIKAIFEHLDRKEYKPEYRPPLES